MSNLGVVATIALVPKPIFVSCKETLGETKDAVFYCSKYKEVISEVGATKVVGTINDNETTMVSAQKLLLVEYPWLINVRCFSHNLNLFAKNGLQKSPSIKVIVDVVRTASKKIKKSPKLNGIFHSIQSKDNSSCKLALTIPGKYRSYI